MGRQKLPNRRYRTPLTFQHDGIKYHAGAGHYPNGDVGEVFLKAGKSGTLLQALCSDAAVAASIALQYGCPIDVLQKAFLRNDNETASSPVGELFDILAGKEKG